jgi:hypothetical protein
MELDAKTMVPEKNKYHAVAAKNIVTEKSMDEDIFYDDYMRKKIFFTGLQPGAHRVVSYKQEIKMPELLPQFFFQSYAPCEESSYTITVPDNVNIEYQLFNVDKDLVHFTVEEKNRQKTYKWQMKDVEALSFIDDNAPSIRYFMPHIVVRVKNYSSNGVNTNVLSSADDLYKWYYGFIKNLNTTKSQELQEIVDSLTHNTKDDLDKVRNIFYWVQDHIRYVAFEAGLQGFIPREADSICQKRYGDCKDMSSILTTMLTYAGFKAYPTWVGTRDIPYTYEELPSPLTDNHMITTLEYKGKFIFLDGTANHLPYGYPSGFIQGKEALIAIDSGNYKIEKIPEVPSEKNTTIDSFKLTIEDRMLRGKAVERLTGYDRQYFCYFLGNLEEHYFKKAMESHLTVGNNKYHLDTFIIANRDDRDKDLIISSQFYLSDYIQQAGDEIYINLNLDKMQYNDFLDTAKRKLDYEEDYKWLTHQHYELEIPKGYMVEYLPPAKSVHGDLFGFNVAYTQSGTHIILDKSQYLNVLLLKRKDFPEWNTMIKELNKAYSDAIILKKSPVIIQKKKS